MRTSGVGLRLRLPALGALLGLDGTAQATLDLQKEGSPVRRSWADAIASGTPWSNGRTVVEEVRERMRQGTVMSPGQSSPRC